MAASIDDADSNTNGHVEPTPAQMREHRGPCVISPNPLVDDLKEDHLKRGVLIPLKTTQEVRQDHTIVQAFITRAPTKSANDVIKFVSLHPSVQPLFL